VADDEETARKIAFNDYSKYLSVTLKGDKYNPSGVLEGGFNKSSGLVINYQKFVTL
jgi:chromosome segregation ATPase